MSPKAATLSDGLPEIQEILQTRCAESTFYPKEIANIDSRIERFKRVREAWEKRPD